MSAWVPALMAATERNDKLLRPSLCLAAVALDDAEVSVEELMSGVTIVTSMSAGMREAIESLILAVLDSGRRIPAGWPDVPVEEAVVIVRDCKRQPGWRQDASDTGRPAVVVVGEISDVHPAQAAVTADRYVPLLDRYHPEGLEAAIRMVTGEHVELEDHWPPVTFGDAVACIAKGSTAILCASRLYKLISKARDDERESVEEEMRRLDEPAPLGRAASGVVKRLSEMTGFGDAGRWGMQAAIDIRAYAAGQLAWSEVDRGILVSGPPGSGKTTFAKSFALEAGVDLVTTTYTEWSSAGGSIGDSMSKGLTRFFEGWRKKAKEGPFVLFIDEIDTMGVRGLNAQNDSWYGSIINAWLAFLDGAVPRNGIIVVAATNHPDRIDPALLRPGRLDRHVVLPYPDASAMAGIIRHHLGPDAVIEDGELARAARMCRGMSPAEVEQTAREARRLARRTFGRRVCCDDLCLVLGARRLEALQRPGARALDRRIAIHEAGHAIVLLRTPSETLLSVDMDTAQTWATGHASLTLAEAEAQLTVLLAGLAAEQLILGDHASGVSGDLRDATALALTTHVRWGMGVLGYRSAGDEDLRDPAVLAAVDGILMAAHQRATALVTESREAVIRLAGRLQADRYLDAGEVRAVVEGPRSATERTAAIDARTTGRRGRFPDPMP